MNKHKYTALKLLNFTTGILLSILYSFLFTKREKRIIFSSSNNKHFIFNSKTLFIEQKKHFESYGFEVFFVMNDSVKRKQLNEKFPNAFISNNGIKNKLFILQSAVWVISTLDLPVSGVFLARKRFVYHLGHGAPIKNIGLMEEGGSIAKKIYYRVNATNISLYLSPSLFFSNYIEKAFGVVPSKVTIAPQPRVDLLFVDGKKLENMRDDSGTKLVLYSPTWRPFADALLFPFENVDLESLNEFLILNNVKILLRLHPLFEGDLSFYKRSNIVIFDSMLCPEISEVLVDIDALITDYSSIYCDYYLLDRPVAFIPYDLDTYTEKIGFSFNYKELTSNCYLDSLDLFQQFIVNVAEGTFNITEQSEMKARFNFITDQNACMFNYSLTIERYRELS